MSVTRVTAKATRSDGWWSVTVPEVPGALTQAERLDQVTEMVQDAVGLVLDIDPDSVEVDVQAQTGHDEQVAAGLAAKATAEAAQLDASAKMREAIEALLADDLTVRDVGLILQVSAARVSQLSSASGDRGLPSRSAPVADGESFVVSQSAGGAWSVRGPGLKSSEIYASQDAAIRAAKGFVHRGGSERSITVRAGRVRS